MELVRGLHNLRAQHRGCAVTIGNFDGVHLGHRATLERLHEHARIVGLPATVLTFEPTPREFLSPASAPARLTRLREKLVLLERERLERCVVLHFDAHLQRVRAAEFIERLLVNDTLNANPAISEARGRVPKAGLKFHVTALVCEVTGGPCKYSGRSMKDSHAHLNINEVQWQAMVTDFRKTLDKFKVPAKEQKELVAIVDSTKKDIVKAQ